MSLKNRKTTSPTDTAHADAAQSMDAFSSSSKQPLLPRSGRPERTTVRTNANPPRWATPEFFIYYLVIMIALPALFMCAWGFSNEEHSSYRIYSRRLSEGWMFGRKVDNSDAQYASFRNNIPILTKVGIAYLILSHIVQRFALRFRPIFSLVFSLIFLSVIYGGSVLKILLITGINYAITKTSGHTSAGVALSWIWCIGILFANDIYRGYMFKSLNPSLAWLDEYGGMMRWYNTFNFTMLRMISFSMDYYWACTGTQDKAKIESHRQSCLECSTSPSPTPQCPKSRIQTHHPLQTYSLLNYLTYILYVPLYLAGPIITFNDFAYQFRSRPRDINLKGTILYALRWVGAVLIMEWMLHTIYVVAIKDTRAWSGFTPFQMSMVGYFNLKLIWLKLLIIWRFFRLWALADTIQTPENMTRCMSDNYSAIEFWRSWHRSFNRWLVRYIYIPLGGAKYYVWNIWPTFTFVAVWHDIELKLLTWGWLVSGFILPEVVLRRVFGTAEWKRRLGPFYRHLAATAAVLNILLMMIANLVGFAVGVDGVKEMLSQIFRAEGIRFLICTFMALFSAVQLMFELREEEKRRGWEK